MKNMCIILGVSMLLVLTSCGAKGAEEENETATTYEEVDENTNENVTKDDEEAEGSGASDDGIDIDLTTMSATVVYAEVYSMYMTPDDYIGEMVKMEGSFSVLEVEETEMIYFSVVIEDALGCCAQGIEFELDGEYVYPEDYPEIGAEVTVVGEFEVYYEYEQMYCRLQNAVFQ